MATVAGIEVNCLNVLLSLAAFFFCLAGLFGICGGVLYGSSHMFDVMSSTHLVNRTTASNFTRKLDEKLDSFRRGSARRGKMYRELAFIIFYIAGGLAVPGIIFLFLAGVEACRTYINELGAEPPPPEPPPAPVFVAQSEETMGCCAAACCADSDTCCAIRCARPDCCRCCTSTCCE